MFRTQSTLRACNYVLGQHTDERPPHWSSMCLKMALGSVVCPCTDNLKLVTKENAKHRALRTTCFSCRRWLADKGPGFLNPPFPFGPIIQSHQIVKSNPSQSGGGDSVATYVRDKRQRPSWPWAHTPFLQKEVAL